VFIHGGFPINSFMMLFSLRGPQPQIGGVVWMWCTIQGIFMLWVVSVVTTMVIGTDIGMHDKCQVC
jgi:hypothetical protein